MNTSQRFSFFASLRGRLLVLVCLATLPATLFTFYVADAERQASVKRSEADAKYILNIVSRAHVNQINAARTLLRWLAGKSGAENGSSHLRDHSYLSGLLAGYPQLANIALVAPNGDVITSAFAVGAPINMIHYEAIQRALHSDEPQSGEYVVGPIVKKPLLHLAQSVRDREGKVQGVVFVALDLDYMNRLLNDVELPPGYALHVLDRQGNVVASSSSGRRGVDKTNSVTLPMEGLPGLQIATSIPYEQIRNKANAEFLRIVLVLSILVLGTAGCVVFVEEVALLRYLRVLARAARRFGAGDFSVRMKMPRNYGELERMADSFNTMADMLEERHKDLVQAHEQLNKLTRHLEVARESERMRIARDLHDEVGQVLTSIKMDLSRLPRDESVEGIREKLDELVLFIRGIASSLRPCVLDSMGLKKALELLARQTERNTDLVIDVETSVSEPLDWLTTTTIYRIVQESLTNVVRHAQASEVSVNVLETADSIIVRVSDNGVGISEGSACGDSLGIIGMRERAKMLNGKFGILDTECGTTIEVTLPRVQEEEVYAYPVG